MNLALNHVTALTCVCIHVYWNNSLDTIRTGEQQYMTEKCRTGRGLEPRVFRLTYERSTS